ncbi:MAG TPA: hypothetical protein VES94_02675 [Burkholderiales bacterium]|nr:hypothetical protein [Burkholderiales bacterium]
MHVLTSNSGRRREDGLRPVEKKYRQREILAGNGPLSGYFSKRGTRWRLYFADRRVIYFATS